tara:strand:+ start:1759 stop:2019 length:261 start_codon:yes stop_codon:yes gene_type:complete
MTKDEPKAESSPKTTTLEALARSRKGGLDMTVISTEPDVMVTLRNWESDETITYSIVGNVLTEIGRKPGRSKKDKGAASELAETYD